MIARAVCVPLPAGAPLDRRHALLLLGACCALSVRGAPRALPEEVKAAYLYRFPDYVEWPAGAVEGGLRIGVAGADAVLQELAKLLATRPPASRGVTAVKAIEGERADVHLLFVGGTPTAATRAWIQGLLREQPMLVVSEGPQGLAAGSALNFVAIGDRLRFEAAPQAAAAAGVKLSSRLLAIAERVLP